MLRSPFGQAILIGDKVKVFLFTVSFLSLCFAEAQSFKSVVQKGHGEVIKTLEYTPDGKYLITGSRDKSAKLWEVSSGREIRSFLGHEHTINDLSIANTKLATSSADGTASVWDIKTGTRVWQSRTFDKYVTSVAFSPDKKHLAVAGYMDSVYLFETSHYELIKTIRTNPDRGLGYGVDLMFSPDGNYLAIGEDQRTSKVYRVSNWELVQEFKPAKGWCGGCGTFSVFDQESKRLLKLSNGASFASYDIRNGEKVFEFGSDFRDITSVDHHKNDNFYLLSTQDSIWIFKGDEVVSKLSLEGEINEAIFHPSQKHIAVALDKRVVVIDFDGNEVRSFDGILNQSSTGYSYQLGSYWEHYIAKWVKYKPARFFSDSHLFVGKTGAKARKWNVASTSILMEYIGHEKGILCFERIAENVIATGAGDGKIKIWDEKKGKLLETINAHREPIFDLQLSHDGTLLASSSWDGVISVWNTSTWQQIQYVYNEGASAYKFAFAQNDAYLITALLDKTLRLLEIETGTFVKEFIGHTDNVTSVEVYENQILTSGWDGNIILWDFYSGLIKHRSKTSFPIFKAIKEGTNFITVGADRKITFWDAELNKESELNAHSAEITGLQVSENVLMSSDVDGVTKFWDLDGKEELYEHIQIGKNDWMIRTPKGYFDATDNAINNIHFVRGMDILGADQVLEKFYVPDLAEQIFTKKNSVDLGSVIDNLPPPILYLNAVMKDEQHASVYLRAEDKGGGVHDLSFFHNGKQVSIESSLQTSRTKEHNSFYNLSIDLVAGPNEFSAVAYAKNGVASNRVSSSLFSESKAPGSVCHILSIGINEYNNSDLNLNYAKPDAFTFSSQMEIQGKEIFKEVVLHQVFDKDATKENILAKMKSLESELSINDVFIFYYAGHGSMIDDEFYIISSSASRLYDNSKIKEYGISSDELQMAMKKIRALKQLVIMDACQSGGSVEKLARRGAPEEKAISQLSRSSGIHIMASAGSDQYATEFESLGHGLFTYALLKGLKGGADGAPSDGKVTIYELKSYLDDQVPELSLKHKGSPQYPHTFSRGQDFPVVIIEK